MLKEASGRTAS